MARIQRTHHPIFQGSLETSTFSPTENNAAHEVGPTAVAPAPQPGSSADAAQVIITYPSKIFLLCGNLQ